MLYTYAVSDLSQKSQENVIRHFLKKGSFKYFRFLTKFIQSYRRIKNSWPYVWEIFCLLLSLPVNCDTYT